MNRAVIFANGIVEDIEEIISNLKPFDMVIAADGGSRHCKSLGIQPDVIIGDLDSMETAEVNAYKDAEVEIIQHPTHKDETDLELALKFAADRGINEVYILGALGARWDMTLANILLLTHPAFQSFLIRLYDGYQELALLRPGKSTEIHALPGDTISLIPIAGDVQGISTQGLEYPLNDETLQFGSSRGVSNVFTHDHAEIRWKNGLLLTVITRNRNRTDSTRKEEGVP
jgi:thiamine pyrophosphokinase